MVDISRGKYRGKRIGGEPASEAGHFYRCELCGGLFDKWDLSMVLDHEGRCRIR
jgi:hypothetical protein